MKLSEIASRLREDPRRGTEVVVEGDGDVEIRAVATLDDAGPGDLTFLSNPKYARRVGETKASAIILGKDAPPSALPTLRAPDAYLAFARALAILVPAARPAPGIHPTAVVAKSAKVGPGSSLGPYVVVEDDAVIGKDAVLRAHVVIGRGARIGDSFHAHAGAVVREGCVVGSRVTLQDGAVVGADGFGFARRGDGSWEKIPQTGIVVLEDDVELQANACVDRAAIGETRVRRGAKVDNLVQVGHGCEVGEDTLLCGQVGLAGTSKIGKSVVLAGQVGVAGHLTVGDGAQVMAQAGVTSDVAPGAVVGGSPADDARDAIRRLKVYERLPELAKTIRDLEARLSALEAK
jgi:UDP-3-O-[3-hydroxymyristoyl] glucosamine N-acyltransferase